MIKPDDIKTYTHLPDKQKLQMEKAMQQDDLSYLSSLAFEQFKATNTDIDAITSLIDKKTKGGNRSFNTVMVSLLCGLFIGVSVFFVIFQKSRTHASVFQLISPEKPAIPLNKVVATDTVFPESPQPVEKLVEHYNTIVNQQEEPFTVEIPEQMSSRPIALPESNQEATEDIIFSFSPNAPVVFISNLKVTNYRLYYFKHSQSINLSINTGLAAQYESNASVDHSRLSASNDYLAHKIIQQAMKLFAMKHYVNCIEELTLLYEFNKDDANAQFYLGMCYYLTGKYSLAQSYFKQNQDNLNNIFHQESEYYEALCLLNTNQKEKALLQLQRIVNNKGFYSTRAGEVISKQK